jgi:hypothetical protein
MWLNLLMDDCYLNNIEKVKNKNVVPNHIWENKNLQFLKNGQMYNKKNSVQDLMNAFLNSH